MSGMTEMNNQGFTLIELVIVLVILSIMAAFALPRMATTDTTVAAQANRLARDLRHAQAMAMNQGRTLSFDIQAPASYRVADSGTTVTDPATMGAFQISLDNGVTVAGTDTDFDSLGRPATAGTLISAARVFTLNGTARTVIVTLSAVTGFVSVSP
ncbi:MAG: type II secretion system protein GspH [Gammaproteobacteria bacterium]|nr:MAG: type II secretion system protein GspH [Gammaproteobacteria bacterium]